MPSALLRRLALYIILPCILAFIATFLNGLFQPQLEWKLKLLETKGEYARIENLGTNTTTLFDKPSVQVYEPSILVYSKEVKCSTYTDVVYIQNQLMQDKFALEKWVDANNWFTSIILVITILQAVGTIAYLIKQKAGWGATIGFILLMAMSVMGLVTLLGPLTSVHFICIAQVKVEAELTKISLDGVIYLFPGVAANILAIIVMVKRYFQKTEFAPGDGEILG